MSKRIAFLSTDPVCASVATFQQVLRNQEDSATVITAIGEDFDVSHPENRAEWYEFELPLQPNPPSGLQLLPVPANANSDLAAYKQWLTPQLANFILVDRAIMNFGGNDIDVILLRPGATPVAPVAANAIPAGMPNIQKFVRNTLGQKGVAWNKASALPAMNGYFGIVQNSFRIFQGLQGPDGGVMTAIYYECKLDIDTDGTAPGSDHSHQGQTSLRDANGTSLNANNDDFAVFPMDAMEAQNEHKNDPRIPLKKAGLPDFSGGLGLNLGDLGVAFWQETPSGPVNRVFFIYGDEGPANNLGEGSLRMAKDLGMKDASANNAEVDITVVNRGIGVVHIGFPGSGQQFLAAGSTVRSGLVPDHITDTAQKFYTAFLNQPAPAPGP